MFSRLLGFARDVILAAVIGAGPVADAFFLAFRLPTIIGALFANGTFNNAFVPVFSGLRANHGRDEAIAFFEYIASFIFVFVLPLVVIIQIAMPWLIHVVAPGFVEGSERYRLAVDFCRISMSYLFFFSLFITACGVLNSFDRFAAAAYAPTLLNISLIGALFLVTPYTGSPGHVLSWAFAASGLAQLIWIYCAYRYLGLRFRIRLPKLTPAVRRLMRLLPSVGAQSALTQVHIFVDMLLASLLFTGAVSYLYYAERILFMPRVVIVGAAATALLPLLSRQIHGGHLSEGVDSLNRALEYALLLTLPATAALVTIAEPIMIVLFERGAFTNADAVGSAAAVAAFAIGLPGFTIGAIAKQMFFAHEDLATPLKISVINTIIHVVLALVLVGPFAHVGIALAMAISHTTGMCLVILVLHRRGHFWLDAQLRRRAPRILLASLAMAGVLWVLNNALAAQLAGNLIERFGSLAVLIGVGAAAYLVLVQILGGASLKELARHFRRKPA